MPLKTMTPEEERVLLEKIPETFLMFDKNLFKVAGPGNIHRQCSQWIAQHHLEHWWCLYFPGRGKCIHHQCSNW
jgi:hypothetical protein